MAQAITHHGFHDAHDTPHPDPARIGALGATMALNLGALLVLAMPMQPTLAPQVLSPPRAPPIVDIIAERPKPLPPPMPMRPDVSRNVPAPAQALPAPQPPVAVDLGSGPVVVPAPSLPSVPGPVSGAGADTGAVDAAPAALRYIEAPPPPYPRPALRAGLTGTVWLRVLVDEHGRPVSVEVDQGSGHRVLDDAARRQVLAHWRFQPALDGDRPVQAWGRVPIAFTLDR